jgi:hypothetical protein
MDGNKSYKSEQKKSNLKVFIGKPDIAEAVWSLMRSTNATYDTSAHAITYEDN